MGPVAVEERRLGEATKRLVAEFHPEKVYLFGSRAWGRATEDSDYDFAVIVAESDDTPIRRAQRAHRALSGLEFPTDILVKTHAEFERYSKVHASIECQVLEEGLLLYG
ncbi:MAG: nucleotidyltransferase domain-containing protein [Coriobacteriia bacterium]